MSRKALLTAALVVWVAALTEAQGARTVRDGVFTDAQATRGQAIYLKQCVSCHGDKLQGRSSATGIHSRYGSWRARSETRCPPVRRAR
jgi:mono/diheme cytochrome c family protein